MKIRRRYRCAYVIDEAKLRRIHGVLVQEFERLNPHYAFTFEVSHTPRRTVVAKTLDEVLALDNSVKSPIRSLKLGCNQNQTFKTQADQRSKRKAPNSLQTQQHPAKCSTTTQTYTLKWICKLNVTTLNGGTT